MCFYMPLLQSCLGGTNFGPDSCGIGMPKSIWLHHRSHTCASTCLCYKVAWGHSVRGPKFGARLLWHRYAKKLKTFDYIIRVHIHVLLHAFATKLPGGNLFGARSSGPDSCGTGMPKNIWLHHQSSHTCASTCLCYKVAWGHPVRGPKFRARLLWHRYGIRTRWIETHVCPLLLLWDEARNPII